jgi:hypothetical protein
LPLPGTRSVGEPVPLRREGILIPVVVREGYSQMKKHSTQKPKANGNLLLRHADTHFRCTRRPLQVLNRLPRCATICIGHPFLTGALPQHVCPSPKLLLSRRKAKRKAYAGQYLRLDAGLQQRIEAEIIPRKHNRNHLKPNV